MSVAQYNQYKNLHIFAKKWRGYKQVNPELSLDEFRNIMQPNNYIKIDFMNEKIGKPVNIYLFTDSDSYTVASQDLKTILSKIKIPSDIIFVTKDLLKSYAHKVIQSFKQRHRVKNYLHIHFNLIIPDGPLSYPHRIMSHEETEHLLNYVLYCKLVNLPKILSEDPQCIWIGCEVGDVIEVKMLSDIAGECVHYYVVVPKSGNIISFRAEPSATVAPDADAEVEEDEEEFRENAVEDDEEDEIDAEDD